VGNINGHGDRPLRDRRKAGTGPISRVSIDAPTDTAFSETNEQLRNDGYATIL